MEPPAAFCFSRRACVVLLRLGLALALALVFLAQGAAAANDIDPDKLTNRPYNDEELAQIAACSSATGTDCGTCTLGGCMCPLFRTCYPKFLLPTQHCKAGAYDAFPITPWLLDPADCSVNATEAGQGLPDGRRALEAGRNVSVRWSTRGLDFRAVFRVALLALFAPGEPVVHVAAAQQENTGAFDFELPRWLPTGHYAAELRLYELGALSASLAARSPPFPPAAGGRASAPGASLVPPELLAGTLLRALSVAADNCTLRVDAEADFRGGPAASSPPPPQCTTGGLFLVTGDVAVTLAADLRLLLDRAPRPPPRPNPRIRPSLPAQRSPSPAAARAGGPGAVPQSAGAGPLGTGAIAGISAGAGALALVGAGAAAAVAIRRRRRTSGGEEEEAPGAGGEAARELEPQPTGAAPETAAPAGPHGPDGGWEDAAGEGEEVNRRKGGCTVM
eukprot:tig00000900_g5387.t1